MKWLIVLFSIFKPFFSGGAHEMPNPVAELKEMIRVNAVKVLLSFAAVIALSSIFAAGLVMIAFNISAQYDQNEFVRFSAMILAGIILVLLPVIIGSIAVKRYDQRTEIKKREVLSTVGTSHPLQDALALLVHDFVKEREMRRAQEDAGPRGPTPKPEHRPEPRHHPRPDERVPSADDFRH